MKQIGLSLLLTMIGGLFFACQEPITVMKQDTPTAVKTVSVDGFQATWHFEGEQLAIEIFAPTDGWVAVGFNQRDDIVNTNLIMGAVVEGTVVVEDQYVVAAGQHPQVTEIGGQSAISAVLGTEQAGQTTISFNVPQQASDSFHYDLLPGTEIYLICAYSREDDFEHHSMMRKHVRVTL